MSYRDRYDRDWPYRVVTNLKLERNPAQLYHQGVVIGSVLIPGSNYKGERELFAWMEQFGPVNGAWNYERVANEDLSAFVIYTDDEGMAAKVKLFWA